MKSPSGATGLAVLVAVALAGCGSSGSDEAKAAAELAPKPPTVEQKAALEKVRSEFPAAGGTPAMPGH